MRRLDLKFYSVHIVVPTSKYVFILFARYNEKICGFALSKQISFWLITSCEDPSLANQRMIKVIFKKKTDIKEDEVNLHNCKIKPDKIKTIKNYGFGFFQEEGQGHRWNRHFWYQNRDPLRNSVNEVNGEEKSEWHEIFSRFVHCKTICFNSWVICNFHLRAVNNYLFYLYYLFSLWLPLR